jgi:hypothetical protein
MGGVFCSHWWRVAVAAEKAASTYLTRMAGERALVDVAITGRGDGTYQDGQTREDGDVKVTTNRGHSVWVNQKDIYGTYKPNSEEKPG